MPSYNRKTPWRRIKPRREKISDIMNNNISEILRSNHFGISGVLTGEAPNLRKRCPTVGLFRRVEENASLLPLLRSICERSEIGVRPFANMQCVGSPTYIHYPPYYISFVPRFGVPPDPSTVWVGAWISIKNRANASNIHAVLDVVTSCISLCR